MRKLIPILGLLLITSASAAVKNYTVSLAPDGQANTVLITWSSLANGDSGQTASISEYSDRTVQMTGTFGTGGSVQLEGSNDGTNFATLTDLTGSAIVKTSAGISVVAENPRYIRPKVTAGDGTTAITITVLGKRG